MKKYSWLLKILVPVLAIMVVVVSFAGVPRWLRPIVHVAPPQPVVDNGVVYTKEDEDMIKELISVYGHMDSCQEVYTAGALDARDPADSAATLHSPFRFCKKGNEFYYQSGDVEMIALKDMYISVSRNAKKIFIGPAKKVLPPFQLPADSLVKIWRSENYAVASDRQDAQTTLRFLCSNHITCKEYRFDYDPAGKVLKGLYMRLTNLDDPLNTAMDKEVKISIHQWRETDIPTGLLKPATYLVQGKEGWRAAGAYADYSLVSLF